MLETAIAITALLWTIYQQYAINKLCSSCPIRKSYVELSTLKEIEKN